MNPFKMFENRILRVQICNSCPLLFTSSPDPRFVKGHFIPPDPSEFLPTSQFHPIKRGSAFAGRPKLCRSGPAYSLYRTVWHWPWLRPSWPRATWSRLLFSSVARCGDLSPLWGFCGDVTWLAIFVGISVQFHLYWICLNYTELNSKHVSQVDYLQ